MVQLIKDWGIDKGIGHLGEFGKLVFQGVDVAQESVDLIRTMQDINRRRDSYDEAYWIKKIQDAETLAEIAKKHVDSGHSYWFSLMAIRMWSLLEAGIEEIAIDCLLRPHECKDQQLLAGLRGPLMEFASASPDQRAEFLLAELRVVTKGALKTGVGVFESLLEPLGMAGPVEDVARKSLLELQQVRHLLVHRRGMVDRRFSEACPWFACRLGEPLKVDRSLVRRWVLAIGFYDVELQRRNYIRAGQEVPLVLEDQRKQLLERLVDG